MLATPLPRPLESEIPVHHALAPNCVQYLGQMARLGALTGDFYLQLGRAYKAGPVPAGIEPGTPRRCYDNSGNLALEQGWAYCEGFAMQPGLFPMHHAWCVNDAGEVIDPTWAHAQDNEYLGVALDESFLVAHCERIGHWGVFAEQLPDFVVTTPPATYLHAGWAPPRAQQEALWETLRQRVSPNRARK